LELFDIVSRAIGGKIQDDDSRRKPFRGDKNLIILPTTTWTATKWRKTFKEQVWKCSKLQMGIVIHPDQNRRFRLN
jgi:hypothetical protein